MECQERQSPGMTLPFLLSAFQTEMVELTNQLELQINRWKQRQNGRWSRDI